MQPMGKELKSHRLATAEDVLAACTWRLAGLDPERIGAATEAASQVLADTSEELASDSPQLAPALAMLAQPGDRRSAWSALCAALALRADLHGDAGLFWRCGLEALDSARQAMRRSGQRRQADQLDVMLRQYLSRHPGASSAEIWVHCAGFAQLHHWVIAEAEQDRLTFYPSRDSERLACISRRAFDQRVSVARQWARREAAAGAGAAALGMWQGLVVSNT